MLCKRLLPCKHVFYRNNGNINNMTRNSSDIEYSIVVTYSK